MTKFIFVTQQSRTASRQAPSGEVFVITKGLPFKVKDPRDVEYFDNNHRFRRVGLLENPKQEPQKDEEDALMEELSMVPELEKEDKENLVKLYRSKDHLVETLEQGYDLDVSVHKYHVELLKSHFLSNKKEKESKKEPVKKPAKKPKASKSKKTKKR